MENTDVVRLYLMIATGDVRDTFFSVTKQTTQHERTARMNVGRSMDVSVNKVLRNLALMDYSNRRPIRVPLLTAQHRQKWRSWARDHIRWLRLENSSLVR